MAQVVQGMGELMEREVLALKQKLGGGESAPDRRDEDENGEDSDVKKVVQEMLSALTLGDEDKVAEGAADAEGADEDKDETKQEMKLIDATGWNDGSGWRWSSGTDLDERYFVQVLHAPFTPYSLPPPFSAPSPLHTIIIMRFYSLRPPPW
jgi:hypothetical protein